MNKGLEKINQQEKFFSPERLCEDLKVFSEMESLSGNESILRDKLASMLEGVGVKTRTDEKGNLWAEGEGEQGQILLCAHMDKVGAGSPVRREGDRVIGRLDDALGLSAVLDLYRSGYRPSALFTVEEESQEEIVSPEGGIELKLRDLKGAEFNAGARYAADKMIDKIFEGDAGLPKVAIIVEASKMGKVGNGPLVYVSGSTDDKGAFRFPSGPAKDLVRLLKKNGLEAQFVEGRANDAIEFSFVKGLGVLAIEVPIENYHSPREEASLNDIKNLMDILKTILENKNEFSSPAETPTHARRIYEEKHPPLEMPSSPEDESK